MATAYGYGRHSTDKQGMTREEQEFKCYRYWESRLKMQGIEWGGFFYDDAQSGGTVFSEREHGRIVYFSLKQGDYLIVAEIDRLFRNKVDGFVTLDQLDRKGVKRVILDLADLSGLHDDEVLYDMVESQLVLGAHMYRRLMSRKMLASNSAKRDAGLPYSRSAPPGWKIVGTKVSKEYRVFALERQMISFMQTMKDDGMSCDEIAFWSFAQKQFQSDTTPLRKFTTPARVLWALRAREAGYPKITNIAEFNRKWRSGEIALCGT